MNMLNAWLPLLKDPLVYGPAAAILVGLFLLVWILRRLFKPSAPKQGGEPDFPMDRPLPEGLSVVAPDLPAPAASRAAPPLGREVADKVDLISQRLVDMQMLLNKQLGTPSVAPQGGGASGGGLSPETVDKLLKIIGAVIQNVEVLQKSLVAPAAPASAVPTPTPHPAPAASPTPTPAAPSRPAPGVVPVSQFGGTKPPPPAGA